MNKKVNTILFLIGMTAVNVLLIGISAFVLLFLYGRFFVQLMPEQTQSIMPTILILASIVIAFFSYRAIMQWVVKKVDLDKYLDPLFRSRYLNRRQ